MNKSRKHRHHLKKKPKTVKHRHRELIVRNRTPLKLRKASIQVAKKLGVTFLLAYNKPRFSDIEISAS